MINKLAPVALFALSGSLIALFGVVRNAGAQLPRPGAGQIQTAPGAQIRSEVDSFERRPLVITKIDGVETLFQNDHGSKVLNARAAIVFSLPDRDELDRAATVQFTIVNVGNDRRKWMPLPPSGRFPNPDNSSFQLDTPDLVKPQLHASFARESRSYHLSLGGLYKKSAWNKPGTPTAMRAADLVFSIRVVDRARKVLYHGQIPVRVFMSQIAATA